MSPHGRTTWWPKDAAWHRRDRIVELGAEHGAAGPMVIDVLSAWAQEQREDGEVKGGFIALAREAFTTVDEAREIVEHAKRIGALDDVRRADGGRLFTCRVSGWEADQTRGRAAIKKAGQRAESDPETGGDTSPDKGTNGHVVPPGRDLSPLPNQTNTNNNISSEVAKATPDTIRLSHLLADLIRQRDPKAKPNPDSDGWLSQMRLLLADRDGDAADVERVLRWSQSDSFWQGNILSPKKLRAQFTQLTIKSKAQPLRAVIDQQQTGRLQNTGDLSRFDRFDQPEEPAA